MRHLTAIAKAALGPDHILFTTDPPVHVKKGSLPGSELLTCGPLWLFPFLSCSSGRLMAAS